MKQICKFVLLLIAVTFLVYSVGYTVEYVNGQKQPSGDPWEAGFSYNGMIATDDFLVKRNNTGRTIILKGIGGILESGTNVVGMFYICDATNDIADPMDIPTDCDACNSADITFAGGLDVDVALDGVVTLVHGNWVAWVTTSVNAPGFFRPFAYE